MEINYTFELIEIHIDKYFVRNQVLTRDVGDAVEFGTWLADTGAYDFYWLHVYNSNGPESIGPVDILLVQVCWVRLQLHTPN